ncbi:MAG: condensation domain-containing protein, partial [Bacteroidota bacterium]
MNIEKEELEDELALLWQDILKIPTVDRTVSFQRLGGNSLRAVHLVSQLQQLYQVVIDVVSILGGITVEKLAEQMLQANEQFHLQPIPSLGRSTFPLSLAQQGIYIAEQGTTTGQTFAVGSLYRVEGPLLADMFSSVFFLLLSRHESLRTVFREEEGEPLQKVLDLEDVSFQVATEPVADANDAEINRRYEEFIGEPFDLENGPLLRVKVLTQSDTQSVVMFSIHHLICDGISLQLLAEEVFGLYGGLMNQEAPNLAPLAIQYGDFAVWQRQLLDHHKDTYREFWNQQLAGFQHPLDLSTLQETSPAASPARYNGRRLVRAMDPAQAMGLQALAREHDVTLYATLFSSIQLLLHYYTSQTDLVVGTVLAGRDHPDLDGQVGLYVNTLPVRTHVAPQESFLALQQQVQQQLLAVTQHQAYPLTEILQGWKGDRTQSNPLFQVVVQMITLPTEATAPTTMGPMTVTYVESDLIQTKFDLVFNLYFVQDTGRVLLDVIYNR